MLGLHSALRCDEVARCMVVHNCVQLESTQGLLARCGTLKLRGASVLGAKTPRRSAVRGNRQERHGKIPFRFRQIGFMLQVVPYILARVGFIPRCRKFRMLQVDHVAIMPRARRTKSRKVSSQSLKNAEREIVQYVGQSVKMLSNLRCQAKNA